MTTGPVHVGHLDNIKGIGRNLKVYLMGAQACADGESDTEDATPVWRKGFARQYEIEQVDGSRGGVQQF